MPLSLKTYQILAKFGLKEDALLELLASVKRDVEIYEAIHAPENERAEKMYLAGINDEPKMSRRRRRSSQPPEYWEAMRKAVHERDNYTCQYCGCNDPDEMSVDHVIPKSRNGSDDMENLKSACFKCNNAKGNLTLEEWIATGKKKHKMTAEEAWKAPPKATFSKRSKHPEPTKEAIVEATAIAKRTITIDQAVLSAARKRDRAAILNVQNALDALDRAKDRRAENNSGNGMVRYGQTA